MREILSDGFCFHIAEDHAGACHLEIRCALSGRALGLVLNLGCALRPFGKHVQEALDARAVGVFGFFADCELLQGADVIRKHIRIGDRFPAHTTPRNRHHGQADHAMGAAVNQTAGPHPDGSAL
ncbi:MAG TPA: hypothetical protein VGL35_12540 [Rhizomicrobium sp.]